MKGVIRRVANISASDSRFLNELIGDCYTFDLDAKTALEYINIKFGKKISISTYQLRKAKVSSEGNVQRFLNNYTRIGYVQNHKEAIEHIKMINKDSTAQLYREINRKSNRNERLILQLKEDIRENTKLLSELSLGTPIIAGIKAKMQQLEKEKHA